MYSHKCIQYSFQTGLERAIKHEEIPFQVPFKMFVVIFFPVFTKPWRAESLCYAS